MFNLDNCSFSDLTLRATSIAYTFTYYILVPYFLTFCLLSNCLLIASLSHRTKTKSVYAYQLFVVLSKTYENLTCAIYVACAYWWAGLGGVTSRWFTDSYVLMYITMRVLSPMVYVGFILPPIASVAMTCDRVFSLWRPIAYRSINQEAHRYTALTICLVISIAVSFDKYWGYVIVEVNDRNGTFFTYGFAANQDYNNAVWGRACANIRTYVRLFLVVALVVLNVLMLVLYRRRMTKLHAMTSANQEKTQARKEANKDLLILSVCQSILTCFDQIPNAAGDLLRQQSVYWSKCCFVITPEYSAAIILASSAEFWLLVAVDRKVRRHVPGYAVLRRVRPDGSLMGKQGLEKMRRVIYWCRKLC